MVIIRRIHIKNFRSISDEVFNLSDFNCFVGRNDSGKSNVLKALNLFFNGTTDFNTPFDFNSDYSKYAKRGQKQAKEITISLDILVPDSYKEHGIKTWTKIWRSGGLHDNNLNRIFKTNSRGINLFNRIQYKYIPAVKSNEYFKDLLSDVYLSMTKAADSTLKDINGRYSKQLQSLTSRLTDQLKSVLGINSSIQLPQDLNSLFRDLTFLTSDDHIRGINLNHRGDGIKARHIPSILRYMQQNIEENRPKKSISNSFVWGFEEPENGVEYLSCFEMAEELYSYRKDCQLLITTHSPAFYMKSNCDDASRFYVYHAEDGSSKYDTDVKTDYIHEQIGFLPLVAPYIAKERERYLSEKKRLDKQLSDAVKKYKDAVDKIIIITEGKTDTKHIKIAFEHLTLNRQFVDRLVYYDFGSSGTLGDDLSKLLVKFSNISNTNRIIGIFDRDKKLFQTDEGRRYVSLGNNVYKFNIPAIVSEERKETDKICIEHYYSNSEIETMTDFGHLYMGKDFDEYGKSLDGHWVFQNYDKNPNITPITIIDNNDKHLQRIDGNASCITKDDFADYVANNPDEFDFSNFLKIYEVINDILTENPQ